MNTVGVGALRAQKAGAQIALSMKTAGKDITPAFLQKADATFVQVEEKNHQHYTPGAILAISKDGVGLLGSEIKGYSQAYDAVKAYSGEKAAKNYLKATVNDTKRQISKAEIYAKKTGN
jgi:hypothetical protein